MTSFISSFRGGLLAATVIAGLEGAYWAGRSPSDAVYRTNFLEFAFRKREPIQKLITFEKIRTLVGEPATIITVGDSSGLVGLRPSIIDPYLDGESILNLNVSADAGYEGYRLMARIALRENPRLRLLVLYITPWAQPLEYGIDPPLAQALRKHFILPWRHLDPPSSGLRLRVTNQVYYGQPDPVPWEHTWLQDGMQLMRESSGWVPNTAPKLPLVPGEADFRKGFFPPGKEGQVEHGSLRPELEKFARLAQEAGVKLVVLFNPVHTYVRTGEFTRDIQCHVEHFRKDHPEVDVPFDLVTTWPVDRFTDPWHLSTEASIENSHRVGRALREVLGRVPEQE